MFFTQRNERKKYFFENDYLSPIYFHKQSKNASKKTLFHQQNMLELSQEETIDPNNRGTIKDYHTNLILIPSIKHLTSFAVNYKNDSNVMVVR